MYCNVLAYDDRQKAKRESIISRPLFSSSDKSLSSTPASAVAASTSSSSSSSLSTKSSMVVQQKLAALSRIRQISSSSRTNVFNSSSLSPRRKCPISKNVLGVRWWPGDQTLGLEPDTKRQQLSDASTPGEQFNYNHVDTESHNQTTDNDAEKVIISDSRQLDLSPANKVGTDHTADALSLVSNYNSSSASSSNDSD